MNVNWIITAFVIVDTSFTTLEHQSDVRAGVPDSEIITVAFVKAKYFANNHKLTLSQYLRQSKRRVGYVVVH